MMTEEMRQMLAKTVTPAAAALLVIDVQNDFCAAGGYFDKTGADISAAQPAIARMVGLIDSARAAGVRVIFARSHYDPIYVSETQNARRRRVGWDVPYCRQGTWGAEFYQGISPLPTERVVIKHRYSAFINTDLNTVLKARNIQSVLVCGVATNVCVETTARDAYMFDYYVTMIDDCSAAYEAKLHLGTLDNMRRHFGLVLGEVVHGGVQPQHPLAGIRRQ